DRAEERVLARLVEVDRERAGLARLEVRAQRLGAVRPLDREAVGDRTVVRDVERDLARLHRRARGRELELGLLEADRLTAAARAARGACRGGRRAGVAVAAAAGRDRQRGRDRDTGRPEPACGTAQSAAYLACATHLHYPS